MVVCTFFDFASTVVEPIIAPIDSAPIRSPAKIFFFIIITFKTV